MNWKPYKASRNYYYDDDDKPFDGIIAKKREYAEPNNDDCMYDDFLRVEGDGEDIEFSNMSGHKSDSCTELANIANLHAMDWSDNESDEEDVKEYVRKKMAGSTGDEWEYSEIRGYVQGDWAEVLHRVNDRKFLDSLAEDYFAMGDDYDCYDGKTGEYIVSVFIGDSMQDKTEEGILDACGEPKGTKVKIVD